MIWTKYSYYLLPVNEMDPNTKLDLNWSSIIVPMTVPLDPIPNPKKSQIKRSHSDYWG